MLKEGTKSIRWRGVRGAKKKSVSPMEIAVAYQSGEGIRNRGRKESGRGREETTLYSTINGKK